MKKIVNTLCVLALVLSLTACSSSTTTGTNTPQETITVSTLNANKQEDTVEVMYDPQRIVTLDLAALDIIGSLGLGDRVVGSAQTTIDYLQPYMNDEVINTGTVQEADLEAVAASNPDVIFIGGRLASSYDALSEIAPVIYLTIDREIGIVESVRNNASLIASLFGKENEVDSLMEGFDQRVATLQEFAKDKTAIIGLVTSGSFNVLGNDGRLSLIGKEVGFTNIGIESSETTSTHGNEASFEYIMKKNPEYVFIMDRDAAISTEGAKLAQEIMENELTMQTSAYKNSNFIYLANPSVWYTAEGGIKALDIMLQDLESTLLAN